MKNIFFYIVFILFFCSKVLYSQNIAPDFKVVDIYGNEHILKNYLDEGKFVFLQFFSVGCGTCQEETPIINKVYEDFGCNCSEIVFIGIDYGADNESVFNFVETYNMNFTAISGQNGNGYQVFDLFGVPYTPFSFLISPSGEIVEIDPPFSSSEELKLILSEHSIKESQCEGADFLYFAFENEFNEQFAESIVGEIQNNIIKFYFTESDNYDFSNLIPSFVNSSLSNVYINEIEQISETNSINLSSFQLNYKIVAEDLLTEKDWLVEIEFVDDIDKIENYFFFYPNPVINGIYLQNIENNSFIEIYDSKGVKVFTIKKFDSNYIDLEFLPNGIYFISKINNSKRITRKLIIQK